MFEFAWTAKRPTKNGYYWFRPSMFGKLTLFKIVTFDRKKWAEVFNSEYARLLKEINGHWQLVEEPKELKTVKKV